jgi:hypothetical protein
MRNYGSVKDPEKAKRWEQIIARQRKSGKTIVDFCKKQGVRVGQFHWWNRRLREMKGNHRRSRRGGFVELVASVGEPDYSGVELRIDEKLSIRLARGFDPQTLKAALATIDTEK